MTIDARHPLPGVRPLVVGAARSGLAAARLLRDLGLEVRLCEKRSAAALPEAARTLAGLGIEVRWEGDTPAALEGRDFVVWSPGIPIHHPIAEAAEKRGIPVLSELELGALAAHAPLVCVTGTNGKSTTTDLIGALLRAAGREIEVCGNIGRAICEVADAVPPTGLLVVEVSSFQLETVTRLKPFVAVWLNLTPDHLERHGDLDTYGGLKRRLFARQEETDYAVWNADDVLVMAQRAGQGVPLFFSDRRPVEQGAYLDRGTIALAWRGGIERLMPAEEVLLPGRHNLMNVLASLAATLPIEIAPRTLRQTLTSYRGLEHRLEPVATVEGVQFVNDSKATNVSSLQVALESFEEPLVLIAGGRDKGQDFRPLADLVRERVSHLVLIGEGAERMAQAWTGTSHTRTASLESAVDTAFLRATQPPSGARPARRVLLSPGCASFDMFQDYEDRGRRFKAEVERLRMKGVLA